MPIYEYACKECGEQFEVFQSLSDRSLSKHDGCGGQLRKVFYPAGLVFKGSGFYTTDSRAQKRGAKDSKQEDSKQKDKSSSESNEG